MPISSLKVQTSCRGPGRPGTQGATKQLSDSRFPRLGLVAVANWRSPREAQVGEKIGCGSYCFRRCCWSGGRASVGVQRVSIMAVFRPPLGVLSSGVHVCSGHGFWGETLAAGRFCERQRQPQQPWRFVCGMIAGLPGRCPSPSAIAIASPRHAGQERMEQIGKRGRLLAMPGHEKGMFLEEMYPGSQLTKSTLAAEVGGIPPGAPSLRAAG